MIKRVKKARRGIKIVINQRQRDYELYCRIKKYLKDPAIAKEFISQENSKNIRAL